jgi:hypothetical protein
VVVAAPRLDIAGELLAVAQAMGRCAVALDHPGVDALPSVGALTWLCPPDDPDALARAMRDAVDLPEEERLQLAPDGMASARMHYDRAFSCAAVLHAYAQVLGRAGSRPPAPDEAPTDA